MKAGELLVGTVARITYDKDFPTFFEVARRVTALNPNARFVIVGDGYGDELSAARLEVQRLGLTDRLHFTGHRTDLKDVYASFDLFLMTSRTEGMPNTLIEAMALELPVVSTAVGGVPELVVDGKTGILCPRCDVQGLAESICHLLADKSLRQEFARSGRLRVEQLFDFTARVRAMEAAYAWFAGELATPPSVLFEGIGT